MINLKEEYIKILQPFKEKMENYVVMQKLIGNKNINLIEKEFVPYDYYNIKCPIISIIKNDFAHSPLFELMMNPNNGEILIEIYNLSNDKKNKLNVYIDYICKYDYSFNYSGLSTSRFYDHFSGQFWNNEDMVEKILDLYLV